MQKRDALKLIVSIAVCEMAGVIGSIFTASSVGVWYAALPKPALNPPSWVFGPVWTILYVLMGVALWLVWKNGDNNRKTRVALGVFFAQLVLNALWSVIFFGLHSLSGAFVELILLWLGIGITIILFARLSLPNSKLAAWLLIPYLAWVSFAGYLNFSLWQLSAQGAHVISCTMEAKMCPDGSYVGRTGPDCVFAACPKQDIINLESPAPGERLDNPVFIKGEARGSWFFEASFPVKLYDKDNHVLAQGIAQAKSDWMTQDMVQFESDLSFAVAQEEPGTLVLEKDNPSGLPQNSDELRVPVVLTPQLQTVKLFYYNPELDKDETGNLACSKKGIVPVNRQIPLSLTPIQDAIRLLLKGELTAQEKSQGLTTEFPLPGVALTGAALTNDGILTLEFTDPYFKTSGGSCRAGVLWSQIQATAEQFSAVKQVRFLPEDLFQP